MKKIYMDILINSIDDLEKLNIAIILSKKINTRIFSQLFCKTAINNYLLNSKHYERVLNLISNQTDINYAIYISNIVNNVEFLNDENYELGLTLLENITPGMEHIVFYKIRHYIQYKKLLENKNNLTNKITKQIVKKI